MTGGDLIALTTASLDLLECGRLALQAARAAGQRRKIEFGGERLFEDLLQLLGATGIDSEPVTLGQRLQCRAAALDGLHLVATTDRRRLREPLLFRGECLFECLLPFESIRNRLC